MSVIRDIYHGVKNDPAIKKPFELIFDRERNMLKLTLGVIEHEGFYYHKLTSATVKEYPQTDYLVQLDNDWDTTPKPHKKQEREILRRIAQLMKKHVRYYKDIPADTIVDYAWTAEIPRMEEKHV